MTRQEAIERINARQNAANIFTNIGEEEIKKEFDSEGITTIIFDGKLFEIYTAYYVSWSPRDGEATYSNSFDTAEQRDKFASDVAHIAKSGRVHTWDKECWSRI